jgi:hypothetical protein
MRSATLTHKRCSWASVDGPMLLQYHDLEWGVPVHSDRKHFEVLVLSGAQAGLSWSLVLKSEKGIAARSTNSIRRKSRTTPRGKSRSLNLMPRSFATA